MNRILGAMFIFKSIFVCYRGNIIIRRWIIFREVLGLETFAESADPDGHKFFTPPDNGPFEKRDIELLRRSADDMASTSVKYVFTVLALVEDNKFPVCDNLVVATVMLASALLEEISGDSWHSGRLVDTLKKTPPERLWIQVRPRDS